MTVRSQNPKSTAIFLFLYENMLWVLMLWVLVKSTSLWKHVEGTQKCLLIRASDEHNMLLLRSEILCGYPHLSGAMFHTIFFRIVESNKLQCQKTYLLTCTQWLIVLGFNDTSTLEGHFVSSPREREKRDRRESRGDEREGQGRKRNRNESEETEEIKTFPLYPYPLQG